MKRRGEIAHLIFWPESIPVPGAGISRRPDPKRVTLTKTHSRARTAPNRAESFQGTRSRPRLVPAERRNLRPGWLPRPPWTG
ncbi:hypothetical protein MPLB_110110 [Mesorhizobium sp. ORS 3324]|nr:hypothetical protein MPLB_110110 [Mesorhizobium sp. ORS 3324]